MDGWMHACRYVSQDEIRTNIQHSFQSLKRTLCLPVQVALKVRNGVPHVVPTW